MNQSSHVAEYQTFYAELQMACLNAKLRSHWFIAERGVILVIDKSRKGKWLCRKKQLCTARLCRYILMQVCEVAKIIDHEMQGRNHRHYRNSLIANMRSNSEVSTKAEMLATTWMLVWLSAQKLCVHRCTGSHHVYKMFLGSFIHTVTYVLVSFVGGIAK